MSSPRFDGNRTASPYLTQSSYMTKTHRCNTKPQDQDIARHITTLIAYNPLVLPIHPAPPPQSTTTLVFAGVYVCSMGNPMALIALSVSVRANGTRTGPMGGNRISTTRIWVFRFLHQNPRPPCGHPSPTPTHLAICLTSKGSP